MPLINPYLNFNGNTEEAFLFYKSVFGGEFAMLQRMGDMQDVPGCEALSVADKNKIMHVALPIGNNIIMGTDTIQSMGHPEVSGNNISLSVSADSKDDADKFFAGLSAGGTVTMPQQDMFWGDYFGMLTDKFGIQWMISYNANRR